MKVGGSGPGSTLIGLVGGNLGVSSVLLLKLGACGRVWVGMGIFRLMVMLMARAVSARRDYLILRYRVRGHRFFFVKVR